MVARDTRLLPGRSGEHSLERGSGSRSRASCVSGEQMSNREFQSTGGKSAEDGGTAPAPLHGIRVIELAHWMAGPAAGGVLADWGAEVIKIEPPGGDPMRKLFSTFGLNPDAPNGAFLAANRGKRSIEIEVKTEAGREVLDRLLQRADVLLTNLRPSALERLTLTPAAVMARHSRLIYCSVTAYGWGGPDQERAGYDLAAFFGRAGISHQVTTQGTAPAALMQGLGDTFTALAAVSGILAALVERQSTDTGRFVEASLLRTGMWALSGELGVQALGGHPRPPAPRDMCPTPLFNSYRRSCGPSGAPTSSPMSGFKAVARSRRTVGSSSHCSTRHLRRNHWWSGSKYSTSMTCGGHWYSPLRTSLMTRKREPAGHGSQSTRVLWEGEPNRSMLPFVTMASHEPTFRAHRR